MLHVAEGHEKVTGGLSAGCGKWGRDGLPSQGVCGGDGWLITVISLLGLLDLGRLTTN